jgi:hypothetical protein
MSIQEINLTQFLERQTAPSHAAQENILDTGNAQRVMNYINSQFPGADEDTIRNKISLLLNCMCQARNSNEKFAFKCNGVLTKEFSNLVKSSSQANRIAAAILKGEGLSMTPQFEKETAMTTYIAKPRFRNAQSYTNTRFSHHLSQNLGQIRVMSNGAAYIGIGFYLLTSGYLMLTNSILTWGAPDNKFVELTFIAMGLGFISFPFVDAYFSSEQNQP